MNNEIQQITLPLPMRMGSVNCYLIKNDNGYFLIDTGGENAEDALLEKLNLAGCSEEMLKLIIITHGDFDHIGNVVPMRNKFGSKVAMHADDMAMATNGELFASRNKPGFLVKILAPLFVSLGKTRRFNPDILLIDGDDLNSYGLEAKVVSIPGHSKGSIGIHLASGGFFCGDLLENSKTPGFSTLMDDQIVANKSMMRLQHLGINTVYPGHGTPFHFSDFNPQT